MQRYTHLDTQESHKTKQKQKQPKTRTYNIYAKGISKMAVRSPHAIDREIRHCGPGMWLGCRLLDVFVPWMKRGTPGAGDAWLQIPVISSRTMWSPSTFSLPEVPECPAFTVPASLYFSEDSTVSQTPIHGSSHSPVGTSQTIGSYRV